MFSAGLEDALILAGMWSGIGVCMDATCPALEQVDWGFFAHACCFSCQWQRRTDLIASRGDACAQAVLRSRRASSGCVDPGGVVLTPVLNGWLYSDPVIVLLVAVNIVGRIRLLRETGLRLR